jgi:hypothetical protein
MAKKQTRRSISVSRVTYERLKAFCEANNISMSQFVETRVGDFLGGDAPGMTSVVVPQQPARPSMPAPQAPRPSLPPPAPSASKQESRPSAPAIPMTSAAARFAVEPPPPVIKKQETAAPKPAEKRPDQIFTF